MQRTAHQRRIIGPLTTLALLLPAAARAEDYTFTKIADNTGPINLIGLPSINTGGDVVFVATLDAGGEAIYVGTGNGMLTTVAETGDLYKQLFTPAINDNGRVVFQATTVLASFPDKIIPDNGIFSTKGGSTITIADNSGSSYWEFGSLSQPSINATGVVSYFANLRGPDGSPTQSVGIFAGVGGSPTTIAASGAEFGGISEGTSINATGTVAFAATRLSSGARGVFTGSGGASTTVAEVGGDFSGFGGGASINDNGVVAFLALIGGNGSAIYTGGVSPVTMVAETGDFSVFSSFENPAINADGSLAFVASRMGSIRGIYTGGDPDDDKVIGVGDELFDSTLAAFIFQRGLNDNGEIVFAYRTAAGVRGIALASPGTLTRKIHGGAGYNGVRVRSTKGGDTVARLRGGIAGGDRELELSYEPGGTFAINGGRPVGDALSFAGAGNDAFVLELTYSDADLVKAGITNEIAFFLQWRDPADNAWKNAVRGNTPSTVGVAFPGSSYDAYLAAHSGVFTLGHYGNDPASNTVWAVLNHNSLFAIAPVPGATVLEGDYNQNGVIDAADYTVWRDTGGTQTGYDTWRANFDATLGSGAHEGAAVPEPATTALLLIALATALCLSAYRRRSPYAHTILNSNP
ncbi:MAG: choice-of-anchor tandem repeat NxxGxxAF-containing protein [Pirellulales bacterium]